MVKLFTITVFLSAALLFAVQPMVAKTMLPIFGGGSSVWTTSMLFYQITLLLGYIYAHVLMTRFSKRVQISVHLSLLAAAIMAGVLFAAPVAPADGSRFPVPYLLGQLALVSGLPFFAISSAGPLLQGWFARTGHSRAHDPYFLYAASNAGSLIGLLGYPFVIEPSLALDDQREVWLIGLGLFSMLAIGAAMFARSGSLPEQAARGKPDAAPISWRQRGRWVFLAFVPSSMLLGVTSYITTDIASFPLLWVIPLAVYLLTMIAAFSFNAKKLEDRTARPMLVTIIAALVLLILGEQSMSGAPILWVVLIQLILLAGVGVFSHARLAADRPPASKLTEFFLMMSLGGALGGVLNGFVAPLVFNGPFEYHLALIAAAATLPAVLERKKRIRIRWMMPLLALGYIGAIALTMTRLSMMMDNMQLFFGLSTALLIAGPAVMMYMSWRDGIAASMVIAVLLGAVVLDDSINPAITHRTRTFYGVHTTTNALSLYHNESVRIHELYHGTTRHGMQIVEPAELRSIPLSYYHPDAPAGRLVGKILEEHPSPMRMGFVGLGSGAMAAYPRENDEVVFFEIDPEVARIANDPAIFTYLQDSPSDIEVRIVDGRIGLERSHADGEPAFDLLMIDAFSSDSIPVHLLTLEAMEVYFQRLSNDGVLLLHISNRNLDLKPLCNALGKEMEKRYGVYALLGYEYLDDVVVEYTKRDSSIWVMMTKDRDRAQRALHAKFGLFPEDIKQMKPWTDQSSDILDILLW